MSESLWWLHSHSIWPVWHSLSARKTTVDLHGATMQGIQYSIGVEVWVSRQPWDNCHLCLQYGQVGFLWVTTDLSYLVIWSCCYVHRCEIRWNILLWCDKRETLLQATLESVKQTNLRKFMVETTLMLNLQCGLGWSKLSSGRVRKTYNDLWVVFKREIK